MTCVTMCNMVTEMLKLTIRFSGLPLLQIERDTGICRASLSRFMRGKTYLRSDAVDTLCIYFGLELRPVRRQRGR